MTANDWDNSGLPPERKGLSTWAKVGIGCGVAFLLVTATCTGGCWWFAKRVEKDPEGFKQTVFGYVKQFMREDWEELRRVVEQLGTDEGATALYRAAPGLAEKWPDEAAFLAEARAWRPQLEPLPAEIPDLEGHDVQYNSSFGNRTTLGFRQANGTRVELTWKGNRQKGVARISQLVGLRVRPKR